MTTRKIRDLDPCDMNFCRDPQHNPSGMRVYQPGEYEHECPSCHRVITFIMLPKYWMDTPTKIWTATKDTIHKYRVRWGV